MAAVGTGFLYGYGGWFCMEIFGDGKKEFLCFVTISSISCQGQIIKGQGGRVVKAIDC